MARGGVRSLAHAFEDGNWRPRPEVLAVEEPLEIRLQSEAGGDALSLAVTMRTPGDDFELVAGFLLAEGLVRERDDLARMSYCVGAGDQRYNVVTAVLRGGGGDDWRRSVRHVTTTSSCGVCGKASLDAVRLRGLRPPRAAAPLPAERLCGLPSRLTQPLFDRTGGVHAAALFDPGGDLVAVREDVGRHNAVDKVVGHRLLAGVLPLDGHVLLVSGRASFEIVQKAVAAGIPTVCAISAPSSLAVDLAREFDLLLVGFLRDGRFNVYAGADRVALAPGVDRPAELD